MKNANNNLCYGLNPLLIGAQCERELGAWSAELRLNPLLIGAQCELAPQVTPVQALLVSIPF